nr:hypothetical protein [Tanacetum cinerariifolium]
MAGKGYEDVESRLVDAGSDKAEEKMTAGIDEKCIKNISLLSRQFHKTERERQEEASKAALTEMYNEVQAHIDVDHELAARMTYKEQEKYTIKERFTHAQLKIRSLEEIQKLYIKEHKWVDAFVPIGSKEDEKRIRSRKKRAEGSSSKHKSPKKQKVNDQESNDSDKGLRNG